MKPDFPELAFRRIQRGELQSGRYYLIVHHAIDGKRGSSYECMKASSADTFRDNDGDHTCMWPSDRFCDVYFLP